MAYVSLYRRYRPRSFAEVVGQDHVTRTLVNAVAEDRVHHAYLFTGPRGTGKTSTARILAKAVNCVEGPTPEPCNSCEHCVAIADGSSVDVIELDMASHGGVDDARELRDRALFAPASSRRKVYILDEVHMASTAAFNALLKLIEEPPGHVLFAMATTDPQKMLPTILSRVQRLDLRRVSAGDLVPHVRGVCEAEGYAITDEAVEAVADAGDGSVRDTLSILEQVLAFAGHEVTAEAVAQVLGHTPAQRVAETVEMVAGRDLAGLLGLIQDLVDQGHDLRRFTIDLVAHMRDLLVLQVAPDRPDLIDATAERRTRLASQSQVVQRDTLLRAVELLADAVAEQRRGSPRLPLELTLAKLVVPGAGGDLGELADRIARLESGAVAPRGAPAVADEQAVAGDRRSQAGGRKAPETAEEAAASDAGAGVDAGAPGEGAADPPAPRGPKATGDLAASSDTPSAGAAGSGGAAREDGAVWQEAGAAGSGGAAREDGAVRQEAGAAGSGGAAREDGAVRQEAEAAPVPTAAGDEAAPRPAGAGDGAASLPARAEQGVPGEASAEAGGPSGDEGDASGTEMAGSDPTGDVPANDGVQATGIEDEEDELAVVRRSWQAVLETIKQRSRRWHAVFEPATPVRVGRGIVTLRYPRRYASFHAQHAARGEYADALREAMERCCGLSLRVDVVVEGEDERRRPTPPSVTPDDARTPVLDDAVLDDPEVGGDEDLDVREAEGPDPDGGAGSATADELLVAELGAELIDERPPSEG